MPEQMIQLAGIPRTSIFTLRGRADEHQRLDALFHDPKAMEWMQQLSWDDDLEDWYSWNFQAGIAIRTKLIDDVVAKHIATHPQALIVELGAGLSSRYYRVAKEETIWVEFDLPQIIQIRKELDTETENHQFLAGSILETAWIDRLPKIAPENIVFIAEGLFYYFEAFEVKQTIQNLRQYFPGATLVLDVATTKAKNKKSLEKASRLGAPMKWFVKNKQELMAMGLSFVTVSSMLQAYPKRWRFFRFLSWIPSIRNANLIIESVLEP